MSNIALLPLYRLRAGVQIDEDWTLSVILTLSDGVTPLDCMGITFTAEIWDGDESLAAVTASPVGSPPNIVSFTVLEAAKASWGYGIYGLSLVATDGTYTRDVLWQSMLRVGGPQLVSIEPVYEIQESFMTTTQATLISTIPPSLAAAIANISAAGLAAALTALGAEALAPLAQAIVSSLPNAASVPVPTTGEAYVDQSGFVTVAQ